MSNNAIRLAVAATTAGALLAAPAAQASDAGLRQTVVRHEQRLKPLAKAFTEADAALGPSASDPSATVATVGAFRSGLRSYKTAVVPIRTQSARAAAGKKHILAAIRQFDLGLVQYQKMLEKMAAGAGQQSLQSTFLTVNERIAAGSEDEERGLRLLKIIK